MKARLLASVVVALSACTSDTTSTQPAPTPLSPATPATEPVELKIATFNIEYGGEVIDFDAVVEGALELDADVIGIEEAWGNIPDLAQAMGWPYFDMRMQIVSRLPLLEPPDGDGTFTYVEVEPGRVVAMGNVHLPSAPYGPGRAIGGSSVEEIIAMEERVRVPALEPAAKALADLAASGVPSFLVGDFNSPSHLDWTDETVGSRLQVVFPVAWPVTILMDDLGFVDSFRAVHPDPVEEPGLTWPAARPRTPDGYNPPKNAPADRIDLVFVAGPAEALDSVRLGEEGSAELSVTPYPTDHRGVVSTFLVEPAVPPVLVSPQHRTVDVGEDLVFAFHAPGEPAEAIGLLDEDGTELASQGTGGSIDGTLSFGGNDLPPGAYEAVLSDGTGSELARGSVWIVDPDAGTTLTVADEVVSEGAPIEVSWVGAPGNRWDWLGIYRRGADPNVASYLLWQYTASTIEGSATFGIDSEGPWPLEPGRYTVYLLVDDSYEAIAGADFTVAE